ncbi:MAG: Stk1 family PASTA domain-containing Ser/Thr kinase [Desulfitobacteriaceae bacterium]
MSKIFGGRYEVIEKIGAGGMAIVYKAKDLLLNRVVTIKVLRDQFVTDEDFIRRFRREAQSAASLSHPNIVSIYDVGKDGDMEYIVMEYIEGRNLKEIIREYAPLSTEQALHLARQLGEALSHAHQHHIIHRDIKPQNILITEDGRAKVTDFGIARAVSSATVTHTGDIIGSVHYLSPEQAKGVLSNEQSDIYSLGIIIYELLTGKVPYDGETPIAIALKHLQEQPLSPSKLNPRIEPELEAVVMRAIAKSPEARYSSVLELMEDLRKVQAGCKVTRVIDQGFIDHDTTQIHKSLVQEVNSAASSPQVTKKLWKRKSWFIVIGAIGLLLLGVGGFWLHSYLTVDETKVPDLKGLTTNVAKILLEQKKLSLDPDIISEFNDDVEEDIIIRQDPDPNTNVKVGNDVSVVVSKGKELLVFPDVKNLTEENARNKIQNLEFTGKITIKNVHSSTIPAGSVVDQDPLPEASWTKTGSIELTISQGPEIISITMPNVIGKGSAEARSLLEQNKLVVVIDNENSNDYPMDVVTKTNPLPDTSVQQGTQVTIYVSSGPGPIAKQLDQNVIMARLIRIVPNDGKSHDVTIKVNDYRGWTEVWHKPYQVGDISGIPEDVRYYSPATMQIFIDGKIQYDKKLT